MSSPNRNKVLVGFGALAVVVVAAITFWPPNFRSEEASGAIGVVQKHHAPQIAQKDVILGDEKTRTQQSILYRDYFDVSAKLQQISAKVASRDSQAANREADALASELQQEYASRVASAIDAAALAAKQTANQELMQECEALAAQAKADREVSLADMERLNSRLASIVQAESPTGAKIILQHAEDALAASRVQDAEQALQNFDLANVEMADRQEELANIEMASKIILQQRGDAEALAHAAEQLQNAALANISEQTALSVSMASMLAQMDTQMAAMKVQNAELASELASIEQAFASRTASSFQAELASIEEAMASRSQFARVGSATEASMMANQAHLADISALAHASASITEAMQNQALASRLGNSELAQKIILQSEELASRKQ